ncbi:ABC transporter substrate-binding protein [Leifsonia sp. Root112D2]|jgi:D-xylose transport system substrate-binding protein|uniref:ABC transporter substrate-binding protein n=1 Tax=Leifsonia sp. Root112D2 TaxID=1736426 RepID=UPI000701A3A7|nr:sugar ABC transporter substrate-binding protein [Leifsonia sp. Root112D2]KQV06596.1 ABC transporter substrate-binding protein [Leifsonia sp. Root112D2]
MKIATTRAIVATAALLLTAGTLTACSNGADTATSNKPADTAKAKIGLLLPDSVTARYASADKPYFEARVKELCPDCTVLYANADGDAAKQQQQAESMLTQGIKAMVLDPFDGQAAAAIVNEAKAKNVPVISYDRLINSADSSYYISFDNVKVGELQATALVNELKKTNVPAGSGILMVNGSPTDNNATQFKKGAHSVIDGSGYKVLAEFDTPGWEPPKAQDWVSGQVTKFGKQIKGVYDANDDTANGAIAALKAGGVVPLPPVTGQDASLAGIQRILAGDQFMTVYKAFKPEAYKAAELAVDLIKGNKPKGDTTTKTAGGADIQSFLLTPVAVTTANIEDTVVKDGLYKASDICTAAYAAACTKYGIK